MRVLLSGASSFTGYWFGKYLAQAGHEVVGVYRRNKAEEYDGVRARRVALFKEFGSREFGCTFGGGGFLELVRSRSWDVYCHHASDVANYRSPEFDPIAATQTNTHNLKQVLRGLAAASCNRIVFTGTVFERGEGQGSDALPAISRYGVSKSLSWEIFLFECLERGFQLGKFVIPNPFGPLEEPRYTCYLANTWKRGQTAQCRTPLYVRDNIPVELLALEYLRYVEKQPAGVSKAYPSGYVEGQGRFTERVAGEFRSRTDWECAITPTEQSEFTEPMIRVNSESAHRNHPDWDETGSWDRMVEFYTS
jgi:UDP-glucose 4-epimerase